MKKKKKRTNKYGEYVPSKKSESLLVWRNMQRKVWAYEKQNRNMYMIQYAYIFSSSHSQNSIFFYQNVLRQISRRRP